MNIKRMLLPILFACGFFAGALCAAEAPTPPEHFYNPPENLNPDPAYLPGGFPMPDQTAALADYQAQKDKLMLQPLQPGDELFGVGEDVSELKMTAIKNETTPVLAYFRRFGGYLLFRGGAFSGAGLLVSLNAFDSGVPGRDGRVMTIFFRSFDPRFSSARIRLDELVEGPAALKELADGKAHEVGAKGTLTLNGVTKPIQPAIRVQWSENQWTVSSVSPLEILLSDFDLDDQAPALMKACNHKAIGNRIALEWNVVLK